MGKIETIITEGHHMYTDGEETRVTFFDSPFGEKLKRMWKQLHVPPKRKHYKGDKNEK